MINSVYEVFLHTWLTLFKLLKTAVLHAENFGVMVDFSSNAYLSKKLDGAVGNKQARQVRFYMVPLSSEMGWTATDVEMS